MLEFLGLVVLVCLIGAVILCCFKFLFWLLILPFKLGFWLLKGAFALIVIVPLALVAISVATGLLPLILLVIALPVLVVGAFVAALVKAVVA